MIEELKQKLYNTLSDISLSGDKKLEIQKDIITDIEIKLAIDPHRRHGVHPESTEEQISTAFKKLVEENPHLQEILTLHELTDNMEDWSDGDFVTYLFAISPGPERKEIIPKTHR